MANHELRIGTVHCQVFIADDYADALQEITDWWRGKAAENKVAAIAVMTFAQDDDVTVEVFWCDLPPGFDAEQEIKKAMAAERDDPMSLPKVEFET